MFGASTGVPPWCRAGGKPLAGVVAKAPERSASGVAGAPGRLHIPWEGVCWRCLRFGAAGKGCVAKLGVFSGRKWSCEAVFGVKSGGKSVAKGPGTGKNAQNSAEGFPRVPHG